MKHSLPLLAVMAATLTTPLMAQDMSDFLSPGDLAADLGLGPRSVVVARSPDTALRLPQGYALVTPLAVDLEGATIASVAPDRLLAVSPRPMLRPSTLAADMSEVMEELVEDAPEATNTVVVAGANTAVIRSGPAPRLTLWQRIFGN